MKLAASILISLLLWNCSSNEPDLEKVEIIPEIEANLNSEFLQQDGAVLLFENLPFNGYLVSYSEQGKLISKAGYINGKREGKAEQFTENGNLLERRFYASNKKVGFHEAWWPNEQKKFEYTFVDGLHHGEYKEWQINGTPYKVFHYVMGFEDGSQKMWDSDGSIRANYVVRNGHRYGLVGLKNCKSVESNDGEFTSIPF
ncbi:MAG: antitoxin component YwqK of YwqJK toxin-antitoxin module [Roseivirga sp.]|jgi:antitoxin component YwqK of YwqJK toxin-antitoxin module